MLALLVATVVAGCGDSDSSRVESTSVAASNVPVETGSLPTPSSIAASSSVSAPPSSEPTIATTTPEWAGRIAVDVMTGTISAPGFNDFIETQTPVTARTAIDTAWMLLGGNTAESGETVEVQEEPEADEVTIVTVTQSNLMDDSIYATRHRLVLKRLPDTLFRFIEGQWSQQCQPGRGHAEFSTELCI